MIFALQIIVAAKYAKQCNTVLLTGIQSSTMAFIALLIAIVTKSFSFGAVINYAPHILYVIFISGAIAQTIQMRCQSKINPSLASVIMSMESVFGALFAWLILNQSMSLRELIGCILIFAAILIAE